MNVLLIRLEAPLMSFGGVAIDNFGVIDELPSASMLTGLLANALGWNRQQDQRLQALQDRLHYAVRVDRSGSRIRDFQTAQLSKDDKAWTTNGVPQKRAGGAQSYESPHLRRRDYFADASLALALALESAQKEPTVEDCAAALRTPKRPLFIGRKPCIPTGILMNSLVEANSLREALAAMPVAEDADNSIAFFQCAEPPVQPHDIRIAGNRNWRSDAHQGVEYWRRSEWQTQP